MTLSRFNGAIFQLVTLLFAMTASAFGQTATSGVPASTGKSDGRAVPDSAAQSPKASAPEDPYELPPGEDPENRLVSPFVKHLVGDQKQFWTSPARFRTKDLKWILPAAGITAAFIASDSWWSKQVNPSHMQTSLHISDYGTYSMIGLTGASFLFGHMTNNDHLQ